MNTDSDDLLDPVAAHRFFTAWSDLNVERDAVRDRDEWKRFFDSWKSEALLPQPPHSPQPVFDCHSFEELVTAFPAHYECYRRHGSRVNVWRASGLGTDELRNSLVLSWMIDRFEDHGHGSAILESLISWANRLQPTGITVATVRDTPYWTRTESLPLGNIESRVDIEIESEAFLIFVEVKIRAGETGDQLMRYVELAERKAGPKKPWLLFFLTPNGRPPANEMLRGRVAPISWRHVAGILNAHAGGYVKDSFSGVVIRQFADHVASFSTM
jgi:hypothetical protein